MLKYRAKFLLSQMTQSAAVRSKRLDQRPFLVIWLPSDFSVTILPEVEVKEGLSHLPSLERVKVYIEAFTKASIRKLVICNLSGFANL